VKKLRAWHGTWNGKFPVVVCAPTKKAAAEIVYMTPGTFGKWHSEVPVPDGIDRPGVWGEIGGAYKLTGLGKTCEL
jgi:hypothetical protein